MLDINLRWGKCRLSSLPLAVGYLLHAAGKYCILLMNLGMMPIKGHSTFPKGPGLLEPHHSIVLRHIQDTQWRSLSLLQRCSQCILQSQLTVRLKKIHTFPMDISIICNANSLIQDLNSECHVNFL